MKKAYTIVQKYGREGYKGLYYDGSSPDNYGHNPQGSMSHASISCMIRGGVSYYMGVGIRQKGYLKNVWQREKGRRV